VLCKGLPMAYNRDLQVRINCMAEYNHIEGV
jgi:argininosuccinate lyase